MLANPRGDRPCFGLVVNGSEFLFLKLQIMNGISKYATSNLFSILNEGNDRDRALQILKYFQTMVSSQFDSCNDGEPPRPSILGELPSRTKKSIAALEIATLEALAIALLDFQTIDDLKAWLKDA